VSGEVLLSDDGLSVDARHVGFTVSPHEECAVEEAVRLVEANGGAVTVLTLGPEESVDQLRAAVAVGAHRAVHLATDGREWDPGATAGAISDAVRADLDAGTSYDLLLFGNEAADTGDYQVPIRVAHALGLPCVTGIKQLAVGGSMATAKREASGGWEVFELPLPAVVAVREGINLPRFASVPGRLRARKMPIDRREPAWPGNGLDMVRLVVPGGEDKRVEVLGTGPEAAPAAASIIRNLGLVP